MKFRVPGAVALALCVAAGGAAASDTPDAVYRAYYAKVIEGRSFDEDIGFHTAARRDEVLAQVRTQAEGSGRTPEEMQTLYLRFTQQLAQCGTLALTREEVADGTAQIVYAVTDTCGGPGGELVVEMIDEDGWKIRSDELTVTAN